MRVISGKYRSRLLHSIRGMDVRPTSDRLRETLFNVLTAGNPECLTGTVWLDLFAGTGAVGIEALSRGARQIYFVEKAGAAAAAIRKNLQGLAIVDGFAVMNEDALHALLKLERQGTKADVVFLDPPYSVSAAYANTLHALGESALLSSSSIVVAEHEKKFDPGEQFGALQRFRLLAQGGAALSFYQMSANRLDR